MISSTAATDKPAAAPAMPAPSRAIGNAKADGDRPLPPLLKDAMPRVTAILVANDRRFATINDGQIVAIGDVLGRRIVIGIDEQSMLLREPSGVQIRVGLDGKVISVERGR